jgi:hypothetical protein
MTGLVRKVLGGDMITHENERHLILLVKFGKFFYWSYGRITFTVLYFYSILYKLENERIEALMKQFKVVLILALLRNKSYSN